MLFAEIYSDLTNLIYTDRVTINCSAGSTSSPSNTLIKYEKYKPSEYTLISAFQSGYYHNNSSITFFIAADEVNDLYKICVMNGLSLSDIIEITLTFIKNSNISSS